MKKLSLLLALVLLLAPFAFAKKIRIGENEWVEIDSTKTKRISDYKKECHRYEIKDDNNLYYDGAKSKGIGDMLGVVGACGDSLKGYDKAKQRQEKRDKKHSKHDKK